jgi:hypothetical protein
MKRIGKYYRLLVLSMIALIGMELSAIAEEDKPSCEMYLSANSQYIWRGFGSSKDSLVIFPEMKVSYKGFSFDIWGDLDTNYAGKTGHSSSMDMVETDYTLAYGNTIGIVRYSAGWIYYGLDGDEDQEVFVIIGLNTFLSPEIDIYRGIEHSDPSWYFRFAISHHIDLPESLSLDLSAWAGYYDLPQATTRSGKYYSAFHDASVGAKLNIPITCWCTVSPYLNYSFPLSDKADDLIQDISFGNDSKFLYGGVTLSVVF